MLPECGECVQPQNTHTSPHRDQVWSRLIVFQTAEA